MNACLGPTATPSPQRRTGDSPPSPGDSCRPLSHCLSVDLEVGKRDGRIHAFAGVRPDTGQSLVFPGDGLTREQAWAGLDVLAAGAAFLPVHNLIDFALPHLRAASPGRIGPGEREAHSVPRTTRRIQLAIPSALLQTAGTRLKANRNFQGRSEWRDAREYPPVSGTTTPL